MWEGRDDTHIFSWQSQPEPLRPSWAVTAVEHSAGLTGQADGARPPLPPFFLAAREAHDRAPLSRACPALVHESLDSSGDPKAPPPGQSRR